MKRGQTLLEGMIAATILAIGVTAIIQAILFSTIQNAGAGRITEAASISGQIIHGLSRYDVRQLKEADTFLTATWCKASPSSEILEYTGGIEAVTSVTNGNTRCTGGNCSSTNITAVPCVVDIDDYDKSGSVALNRRLVPGYDYANRYQASPKRAGFKRVAVVFDDTAATGMVHITVVTSFLEGGRRKFVRRNTTLTQANGFAGL